MPVALQATVIFSWVELRTTMLVAARYEAAKPTRHAPAITGASKDWAETVMTIPSMR